MTYEQVADHFDITLCPGCGDPYDHQHGEYRRNRIHWAQRKFTRAGLRNFLLLVARDQFDPDDFPERWRQVWNDNVWAASVARKEFHTTIPTRLSQLDRAYVWAHIQSATNVPAACRAWAKPKEYTNG